MVHACGGWITADALTSLSTEALRACGLSRAKVRSVSAIAAAGKQGVLDGLGALDDAEVIARLSGLPGIGRWTAEMFLIFALRRPDVLPALDLGLRHAIAKLDGLPPGAVTPSLAQARGLVWRPWRTAAVIALWAWRRS